MTHEEAMALAEKLRYLLYDESDEGVAQVANIIKRETRNNNEIIQ